MDLNVADIAEGVTTLGPGRRVVLWVQGCPLNCPGCIAPEYQPRRAEHLVNARNLAERIASCDGHDGLTVSGGEPMLQSRGLHELWSELRARRPDWTLIVYSGYTRAWLLHNGSDTQLRLMKDADAFVDGLYVAARNDDRGLRGSSNQSVWFSATSRFGEVERRLFTRPPRQTELRQTDDRVLLVGVPPSSWLTFQPGEGL